MAPGSDLPLPPIFDSQPDDAFPVYHVLREVGELAGGQVREVQSTDTLSVVGLALVQDGRSRLLVANLTGRAQSLTIRGLEEGDVSVFRLDGENVAGAKRDPEAFRGRPGQRIAVTGKELDFHLPAYGIARIDQN